MDNPKKSIAILGAGKLGIVVAQLALKAGYKVYIAGSSSPDKIRLSVNVLAPGAIAVPAMIAINSSDIIILALPLGKYRELPRDALAGKLVIDAMNYWWEVDGDKSNLIGLDTSTSEMIQTYLDKSSVVKAISHIGYHHLHDEARQRHAPERKSIAITGNNDSDVRIVASLVDDLGFDPLVIGNLASGIRLEPGYPAFGAHVGIDELSTILELA